MSVAGWGWKGRNHEQEGLYDRPRVRRGVVVWFARCVPSRCIPDQCCINENGCA
jgi:hypothetical protein